jgi:hypothetical protein
MFVLITVPHGFCLPDQIKRMCDNRALSCAKILTALLKEEAIEHKTITIHVPRQLVDVNRDKPDMSPDAIKEWNKFNQRVASTIMQQKAQPIFFLDIHSFPKGSFKDAQIAILDIFHKTRPELEQLVTNARESLGLKVALLKGGKNYIQDHYQTEAYPLLIEFCEDKTYLSQRDIKAFFALLLDWVKLSQVIL